MSGLCCHASILLMDLAHVIGVTNAITPTILVRLVRLGYVSAETTKQVNQKGGAKAQRRIRRRREKAKAEAKECVPKLLK